MWRRIQKWLRRLGRRDLALIVIAGFVSAIAARLVDAVS